MIFAAAEEVAAHVHLRHYYACPHPLPVVVASHYCFLISLDPHELSSPHAVGLKAAGSEVTNHHQSFYLDYFCRLAVAVAVVADYVEYADVYSAVYSAVSVAVSVAGVAAAAVAAVAAAVAAAAAAAVVSVAVAVAAVAAVAVVVAVVAVVAVLTW